MSSNSEDGKSPLDRIRDENDKADQVVEFGLGTLWPFLVLLAGPALTGLISADVAEQRDFWGLFFSTLAWSSGVALFAFLLISKAGGEMGGWPMVAVGVVCLLGGSWLAVAIGQGMYDVPVVTSKYGSNPWGWVLTYADAAIVTFGPLGALLGLISGVVAGNWGARLYKAT